MATSNSRHEAQLELLVRLLPHIGAEERLALKGGTAINLFVRDMPRLSVDLDIVYLPIDDRPTALGEIGAALQRVKRSIERALPETTVVEKGNSQDATTVFVRRGRSAVKIEVNFVTRGTVHAAARRNLVPRAEERFGSASVPVVSFEDLYAGKLVAALDRQHPRDLFDVKMLLEAEGVTDSLFTAFLVYLLSHNRTFADVLDPARKDVRDVYEKGFAGMALIPTSYEDLLAAREALIAAIQSRLGEQERRLLLSFKRLAPDWSLLPVGHAPRLPAIRWKLQSLSQMDPRKREAQIVHLERVFDRIAGR